MPFYTMFFFQMLMSVLLIQTYAFMVSVKTFLEAIAVNVTWALLQLTKSILVLVNMSV